MLLLKQMRHGATCEWAYTWVLRALTFALVAFPVQLAGQSIEWTRQFGSTNFARGQAVAADVTGIYVGGQVLGALSGATAVGPIDAYLRKYDATGTVLWTKQFGQADPNGAAWTFGVAAVQEGVYAVGQIVGPNPERPGSVGTDIFVRKFDVNGNELWNRRIGSANDATTEIAYGVAADSSGVYVVGTQDLTLPGQQVVQSRDVLVLKYDPAGTLLWTDRFGGPGWDQAKSVAVLGDEVYVGGMVSSALPGQTYSGEFDAFVRKYDLYGNVQWTRQYGSPGDDSAEGLAVSAAGIHVAGYAIGALPNQTHAGGSDAYLRKYDSSGNELWTRQFGSGAYDSAWSVAVSGTNIYVAGYTVGSMPGFSNLGAEDAFFRRFSSNGTDLLTLQFGGNGSDSADGLTANASGIYLTGATSGALPGQTKTGPNGDAYLIKLTAGQVINIVPEILAGGIVNNASYVVSPAPLAMGSIAAVFGSNLTNGSSATSSLLGPDSRLITTLAGASVRINNVPAPLFYATPGQLGVQIPVELLEQSSASIQVTVEGQTSAPRTIALATYAPGLFTANNQGTGAAAALHQDGVTPVTIDSPARRDEVIVLFGTGLGPVNPPVVTGELSQGNRTTSVPTITIDSVPAPVEFSGLAPGFAGLYQINVRIPAATRTGQSIPLQLSIAGRQSKTVNLSIAP